MCVAGKQYVLCCLGEQAVMQMCTYTVFRSPDPSKRQNEGDSGVSKDLVFWVPFLVTWNWAYFIKNDIVDITPNYYLMLLIRQYKKALTIHVHTKREQRGILRGACCSGLLHHHCHDLSQLWLDLALFGFLLDLLQFLLSCTCAMRECIQAKGRKRKGGRPY